MRLPKLLCFCRAGKHGAGANGFGAFNALGVFKIFGALHGFGFLRLSFRAGQARGPVRGADAKNWRWVVCHRGFGAFQRAEWLQNPWGAARRRGQILFGRAILWQCKRVALSPGRTNQNGLCKRRFFHQCKGANQTIAA